MGFLTDIAVTLRAREAAAPPDLEALRAAAAAASPALDVVGALRAARARDGIAVIAEVKRASPSAGVIATEVEPAAQARAYEAAGAAMVSVLTEPDHFHGSIDDLRAVRAAVALPALRKDFVIGEAQVLEARAAGADCVLLITAMLDDDELARLLQLSRSLGMEPLVETHDDLDVARALATDARILGVNARNLETLEVDVAAAVARLAGIDPGRLLIAESGLRTHDDVEAARRAGASAILVGETLMRAGDPAAAIAALVGRENGDG